MKKTLRGLYLAITIFIIFPVGVMANNKGTVIVNNKDLELGNWLIQNEGTSYIPYTVISNLFGANIKFDNEKLAAEIITEDRKVWYQAGNKTTIINDQKLAMDNRPVMVYNTLFIPLKSGFTNLGADVHWDSERKQIVIDSDKIDYTNQPLKDLLREPLEDGQVMIQINAAGDTILGYDEKFSTYNRFDTVVKENNNNYKYFFDNVRHIFDVDDLTIINLENPFTNSSKKANKEFAFKGKPEYLDILTSGSVEVVNLANNHTYDYFQKGMDDTILNLKKRNIDFFGNGIKSIKNVNGVKIGNLGYKGWYDSQSVRNGIKKDISYMKQNADLVIVTFHWGIERENYPNKTQKDLGRFAIDNGADLVIGHHPHVIQGIEEYKDKYIVYSLGNFCFGGNRNPSDKDTFIFQQNFILDKNKKIVSSRAGVIPCSISSVSYKNDYRPTPKFGSEADRILKRLRTYSSVFPKGAKFLK